jgi:hypothetical protein
MIRAAPAVLAELFVASAESAVIRVLQESGRGLTKGEIIKALVDGGVDEAAADRAWDSVRRRLNLRADVAAHREGRGNRYTWIGKPMPVPRHPSEAFEQLLANGATRVNREVLIEMVRTALDRQGRSNPASRAEQVEMDAARALAEMAIEVEELAAKEASARAMIHRVRARMKRMRLEPIDRAGDQVAFDRQRHQPIGPDIPDGAPVVVVRPGYVWKTPNRDLLIERPVVQD